MSILDGSRRAAEAAESDPTAAWDDLPLHLHMKAWTHRRILRCDWVRDPMGQGMISVWAPEAPTAAESL